MTTQADIVSTTSTSLYDAVRSFPSPTRSILIRHLFQYENTPSQTYSIGEKLIPFREWMSAEGNIMREHCKAASTDKTQRRNTMIHELLKKKQKKNTHFQHQRKRQEKRSAKSLYESLQFSLCGKYSNTDFSHTIGNIRSLRGYFRFRYHHELTFVPIYHHFFRFFYA